MEKVSVVIPTMKGREYLLNKLLATLPEGCEKIIIDDNDLLLAAKRNKGASLAARELLFFIDDDNYLLPYALKNICKMMEDKNVGVAGMMALYDDKLYKVADGGSRRSMITGFTTSKFVNQYVLDVWKQILAPYIVDEVANAFMIRKEVFLELDGFDDKHFPIELDESDLCFRARERGYKVVCAPHALVVHQSITYSRIPDFRRPKNAYFMGRNRILFQRKHLSRELFAVYLFFFFPLFILSYCLCLLYRRKFKMIYHFLKGANDGLQGRLENSYQ